MTLAGKCGQKNIVTYCLSCILPWHTYFSLDDSQAKKSLSPSLVKSSVLAVQHTMSAGQKLHRFLEERRYYFLQEGKKRSGSSLKLRNVLIVPNFEVIFRIRLYIRFFWSCTGA